MAHHPTAWDPGRSPRKDKMTPTSPTPDEHQDGAGGAQRAAEDVVARILARAGTSLRSTEGTALASGDGGRPADEEYDGDQLEREERAALRRVGGLSTELEDVTEVEYRQLRLERVVLVGLWSTGTA